MPYTPVELRHVRIGRALFGYKREATERLLDDVAASFEGVWRERGELVDQLEVLEAQLAEIREREHLLAATLVAAEKAAAESRDAAKRDAELIVAEAHQESRSITRGAQAERERLFAEARRVEALLRGALGMVEESRFAPEEPSAEEPADEADEAAAVAEGPDDTAVPDDTAERAMQAAAHEVVHEVMHELELEEPSPFGAPPEPVQPHSPWENKDDTAEFPSLVPKLSDPDGDAG